MDGISVQSDLARKMAAEVAAAASMGLISTEDTIGNYTRIWRVTESGLYWIRDMRQQGVM